MPSGTYTVRMTLGPTTVSQSLQVVPDPRAGGTPAAEREHAAMVVALASMSAEITGTLTELRAVRSQARELVDRARSVPVAARDAAIHSLIVSIDSLESIVVSAPGGGFDILHIAPRLNTDVAGLLSAVEGTSAPVTSGERDQLARLRERASAFHTAAERVLSADVEHVNAQLTASGLTPPITRRRSP
jgi:hypothetical protein